MLSWLFGKSKSHQEVLQLNLQRISFLMDYLQQCSFKEKEDVVDILNKGLILNIPSDAPDPEDRLWVDPSNSNLAISFSCNDQSFPSRVNQLSIIGFKDIANTLIIGTATEAKNGKLMWSISTESEARNVPALARVIQKNIWVMPGWKVGGFSGYQYLERK